MLIICDNTIDVRKYCNSMPVFSVPGFLPLCQDNKTFFLPQQQIQSGFVCSLKGMLESTCYRVVQDISELVISIQGILNQVFRGVRKTAARILRRDSFLPRVSVKRFVMECVFVL